MLRVWIPRAPGGEFLPALTSYLEGVDVVVEAGSEPEASAEIRVLVEGVPTDEQLAGLPNLEAVVIPYAGVPTATRERLLARPDLALHNIHHNAAQTAEMAVTLFLAAAKRVVPFDRALRKGDWRPRYEPVESMLLDGKRAVVLGHGAIGRRVARALVGLGMHVTAVRRTSGESTDGGVDVTSDLDGALDGADALIVCLPATPATEGLIDDAALARLAAGAVVVNVGRGPIVDEGALYRALTEGSLGGAGFDVWYRYPKTADERSATLPSTEPFHELDTVVFSPHRAGKTQGTESLRARHVAELLRQVAQGDEVAGRVDLRAGY